jgi:DinB family protein
MLAIQNAVPRPQPDEHAPYYSRYIELVPGDDGLAALKQQIEETLAPVLRLDETRAGHRYAPGKWTVKQLLSHVSDAERVFSYRALRIARNDSTPLPGFDENAFADASAADRRPLSQIVAELRAVRAATVALFEGFEPEAMTRRGIANDSPFTVRALAWIAAGHERHHRQILRERYGVGA